VAGTDTITVAVPNSNPAAGTATMTVKVAQLKAKRTVYFKGNSAVLTKATNIALRELYDAHDYRVETVTVTGVVNTRKFTKFTRKLAAARAASVLNYLEDLGLKSLNVVVRIAKGTKGAHSRKVVVVFAYLTPER
jgi:outer membrane protein OmpA-like peptidoglycan-associated protein